MTKKVTQEYVELTHKGRIICDRKELREGYCGSVSLALHAEQMRDPTSWVQYVHESWVYAGMHGFTEDDWEARARAAEKTVETMLAMTRLLDEHPEEYDGPCECKLCLSYADCEGLDFDRTSND